MSNDSKTGTEGASRSPIADVTGRAQKVIKEAKSKISRAQSNDPTGTSTEAIREKLKRDEIVRDLEKLYSPEAFEPIVAAPANLMLLVSGRKLWELSKEDKASMAVSSSTVARYLLSTEPKWVAIAMMFISIGTIYGSRAAMHVKELREERKKKETKPT